jgi:hypothetical protein
VDQTDSDAFEDLCGEAPRSGRHSACDPTQAFCTLAGDRCCGRSSLEVVRIGMRAIVERRPRNFDTFQDNKNLPLPGFLKREPHYVTRSCDRMKIMGSRGSRR